MMYERKPWLIEKGDLLHICCDARSPNTARQMQDFNGFWVTVERKKFSDPDYFECTYFAADKPCNYPDDFSTSVRDWVWGTEQIDKIIRNGTVVHAYSNIPFLPRNTKDSADLPNI